MKIFFQMLLLSILLVSCGKNSSSNDPQSLADVSQPIRSEISVGQYTIPCYFNRPASEGNSIEIYTIATLTLKADGKGTNSFELYSDSECKELMFSGKHNILHSETILIDNVMVFKMDQKDSVDEGAETQTAWIPYAKIGDTFFMDLDYHQGESGAYLWEPSPAEVAPFKASPSTYGIAISK